MLSQKYFYWYLNIDVLDTFDKSSPSFPFQKYLVFTQNSIKLFKI